MLTIEKLKQDLLEAKLLYYEQKEAVEQAKRQQYMAEGAVAYIQGLITQEEINEQNSQ